MAHGYAYGSRHRVPSKGWPAWKKQCRHVRPNGSRCRSWSAVGTHRCAKHGSAGIHADAGWRRYLVGVISGAPVELIDPTLTPNAVADELAIWVLRDETRVSAKIKLGAARYLWDVIGRADRQDEAFEVLEPSLGAQGASDVVQLLRRHRVI
jgi:hypothetical protein